MKNNINQIAMDQKDRFLEAEDMDQMTVFGTWTAHVEDMSGSLGWTNPYNPDVTIYATPNWENEDGKTPFELAYTDGSYKTVLVLNLDKSKSVDSQRTMYIDTLKLVIKTL